MPGNSSETEQLLEQAAGGDKESLGKLLTRHENRLRRMITFRLDQRLQGRIDPSDVIQEVYLSVAQHLPEYQKQEAMPFFLWLRGVAGNKLRELHRYHLGTQMRDAGREVSLYHGIMPEIGGVGGPAVGAHHSAQRGGYPGRSEDSPAGGAQQHGYP